MLRLSQPPSDPSPPLSPPSVGSVGYDTWCESRPTSSLSRRRGRGRGRERRRRRRHSFDTVKACARGWTGSKNETEEDALGDGGMLAVASYPTTYQPACRRIARESGPPAVKGSHKIAPLTFLLYHPASPLANPLCRYIPAAPIPLRMPPTTDNHHHHHHHHCRR